VEGRSEVTTLVTGVTASQALLDAAVAAGADAVLVHHGYFWKGEDPTVRGMKRRRLTTLLAHDINLIAYHLPLDAHPTLGNNAPFIGLFGTVIGVVGAFRALGEQAQTPLAEAATQALAPAQVMSSISEALVATAVGIAIAIPAVAANNFFQRATKRTLANTEALTKVLLAHMKAVPEWGPADDDETDAGSSKGRKGGSKRRGKEG